MATDLITHITLCLKAHLGTLNKFIVLPNREKKEEDPLLCVLPHYSPDSPKELEVFPVASPCNETQQPNRWYSLHLLWLITPTPRAERQQILSFCTLGIADPKHWKTTVRSSDLFLRGKTMAFCFLTQHFHPLLWLGDS